MPRKLDVLRIVKEDILEALGRENKKVPFSFIEPEIKVSRSFIFEALRELKREGLVQSEGELVFLAREGKKRAEDFIKRHSILENYFKKARSKKEAWEKASILEHYISIEVIDNIKELSTLKKESIPLTEMRQKEGLITDILFNIKLFERIISLGILPGEKIKIVNELPDNVIVEVRNKKFALAKKIAKGIKVLK